MRDAEGDIVKFTAAGRRLPRIAPEGEPQSGVPAAGEHHSGRPQILSASLERGGGHLRRRRGNHRQLVEALRMRDTAAARNCSISCWDLAARDLPSPSSGVRRKADRQHRRRSDRHIPIQIGRIS